MGISKEKLFLKESKRVAFDYKHRATIRFNISKYDKAVSIGQQRYADMALARNQASVLKRNVLKQLPYYLEMFEEAATANGCEVLWAETDHAAVELIKSVIAETDAKQVVKSKSMSTEEISINEALEAMGVQSIETDLGEFIVQVAGEKPYHIVTPAMHKSKSDIAALFHQKFNTSLKASPEEMTLFVRNRLRENFKTAPVGITGANFLLAREGGIALTENEGNGFLTVSFPKVHIVVAGIEKVLPSWHDLDLMWPLLAVNGTGQKVTVYNSVLFGPARKSEVDGPERMVVILLDNGRTRLFAAPDHSEALACIRCGACLNACPIYKNVGGYTYNSVYSGPIGAVITPHLKALKEYQHLSFASSLCGKCEEVCPVKIPLPDLLLKNRRDATDQGLRSGFESVVMGMVEKGLKSRNMMDLGGGKVKNLLAAGGEAGKILGKSRTFPDFASESFSRQWKKRKKDN